MRDNNYIKLKKFIIVIVCAILAFTLISITNNVYAKEVKDISRYLLFPNLPSSYDYDISWDDIDSSVYLYCCDSTTDMHQNDTYEIKKTIEFNTQLGKFPSSDKMASVAFILANRGNFRGTSRGAWDIRVNSISNFTTWDKYVLTSDEQNLIWMALNQNYNSRLHAYIDYDSSIYSYNESGYYYHNGTKFNFANEFGFSGFNSLSSDLQTNYKLIFAGGQHSNYFENGDKFDKMYKGEKGILVKTNYFRKRENISPKNLEKLKVEYDIEKISEPDKLTNVSGNITSVENWESKYMAIGPITFNVGIGDWLNNFKVTYKDNEGNSHTVQPTEENDVVKLLGWTTEGNWMEFTAKDFNEIQKYNYMEKVPSGYCYKIDQEPILYLLVKKDAKITEISKVYIEIGRQELSGKFQLLKSKTGGQELLYGNGKTWESKHTMEFSVEPLISPVQVELNKVDTAGTAVEGAKFSIAYSNGLKGETKTVEKGKIKFTQVQPTSPDSFTATITETYTPAGYKPLEKPIVLKFTYDQNTAQWKAEKTSGPNEKITIGTVIKDSKSGINKIPITVENKSIIEKLTLKKVSSVGEEQVNGAKFKLTLTNVASIKNHQVPTTGTITIIETTKDGNIVLEDIEITDLSKEVTITIEEIEAPVGYKKIEGKITVTLKREGNTYKVSETKKDDTVTDAEFKAGKVTLENHELTLNIKDIPIMNLGGIVWAEKIKTDKEQPDINNTYSENDDEALGGITVRLLNEKNDVVAKTKTAQKDGEEVTYLNNLGKEGTVKLKQGQYLFTKLDDGTNYIPVGTDYKVEIDYDGMTYNALMNTDKNVLYTKNGKSKITSEYDHGLAEGTKTIVGTENKNQSSTNGGYIIDYTSEDNKTENVPDKAIYSKISKDGNQVYVTARSETYLQKTEDWRATWKDNNGVGEINLDNDDNYAIDINFGLYKKFFDLNLGTNVDSAKVSINGQTSTYTYDQILDGELDRALRNESQRTTDDATDYNLYLAYSDYYYRIDDYKVPGDAESLGNPYGDSLTREKDEATELEVYVTYNLQINNQSTQHNAERVKVKYSYDEGYKYVESNGEVEDIGKNMLEISNINVAPGEKKTIQLTFKVKKNENDGTFFKDPKDEETYTNMAEIIEYSTKEGRLVDADSAPGNTFLEENAPTSRREDDTDTANGIIIRFKENAERSISGKVFKDSNKDGLIKLTEDNYEEAVSDVIVQLIELVEINNQQYEYIWQETVAGQNTVKTTATSGGRGATYEFTEEEEKNKPGEYKFTERIIPGNYIVRFIYGDGTYFDNSINNNNETATEYSKNNIKTYNGEDYKSTYVGYDYNAEWYNNTNDLNGDDSKAVDNEARRLKVMSYAVDVDGTKGAELAKLDGATNAEGLKEVLANTWMCAETLKIKVPVDADKDEGLSKKEKSTSATVTKEKTVAFDNVNFGLMERPKTKLVLEKYITGLTVKPVASGVNLIANATADINDILKATAGDTIELKGQKDGLFATKSGRDNRGLWYLQTDTTELAQGADAYITYTYVIRNEGDEDYLSNSLVQDYINKDITGYADELSDLETTVKSDMKSASFTKGKYLSGAYYKKNDTAFDPTPVLASVEQIQEALNPKVKFVNSTTDFNIIKNQDGSTLVENKNVYKEDGTGITEEEIKEQIESTKATGKMKKDDKDTSKKLVVSVGLSASEIENGGVYDSYIAQVTHYTNAAGRRDESTPDNLSYVHSEDTTKTLAANNEQDEFWAERFTITKPTGEDKLTPVQIAIITISSVAVLGVGIILIKKFVLKK